MLRFVICVARLVHADVPLGTGVDTSSGTAGHKSMLAGVRAYAPTVLGGLAVGGGGGVLLAYLADLKKQERQQELSKKGENFKLELLAPPPKVEPAPPPAQPHLKRWYDKWENDQFSWHLDKPNPILQEHYDSWLQTRNDEDQRQILFPLCGTSVDLASLARRGHLVVGVEGISKAVDRLLTDYGEELPSGGGIAPGAMRVRVSQPSWIQSKAAEMMSTKTRKYTPAPFLMAVQGDFLEFTAEQASKFGLNEFDACFDRGGLVAVEPPDRRRYADNLAAVMKPGGKLLLVTVEHDPAFGPPHSVDEKEVKELLGTAFDIKRLSRENRMRVEPRWKERGATSFYEVAYMCTRKGSKEKK